MDKYSQIGKNKDNDVDIKALIASSSFIESLAKNTINVTMRKLNECIFIQKTRCST